MTFYFMLENSQDILNIVKAVSVGLLAMLMAWLLFYSVMIVRQMFKLVKGASDKVQKVDQLINKFSTKLGEGVSGFIYLAQGIKLVIDTINNKKEKKKTVTKAQKKK